MRVAIYDFDGTIYKNETFPLMMAHLKTHPTLAVYSKFYRSILPIYIAYKLKIYPEEKMKAQMMKRYLHALHQLDKDELNVFFAEIAEKMHDDYHELVVESIQKHKQNGLYIMVVSGAYTPLLRAALNKLPIDEIIGTKVPLVNGNIDRLNNIYHVQAERKKLAIEKSLRDFDVDWKNSYAYGDSFSDLPVLEMVGHPVVVAPDEKLKHIANERQWEMIR